MKQNMTEWKNSILQSGQRQAIPILTHTGIELNGKHVKDAVTDGMVHYEAILTLSKKYPAAAATTIMDLTVEAEAFGANIVFPDDEVPSVTGRLVDSKESIERLEIPSIESGRIQQYLLAGELAAKNIEIPVFAGCIGPFSLAGRLYGMSDIMMGMYIDPEATHLLLKKCTAFITAYCMEYKKRGVAGILIAEPAAGLLSNDACKEFSSVYLREIIGEVQDDEFMAILHNCGNTGHCTEAMLFSGAAGYHFGNRINMEETLSYCPEDVLIMGNLDPVSVFKMSTPQKVYSETTALLNQTRMFPNFILSSGCDIPPHVSLDNLDSFYNALMDYNKS